MAESAQHKLSFSELHQQIEGIAEALQSDDLSLEEAIDQYEKATAFLKLAQRRLEEAEQRVRFVEGSEERPAEEQGGSDESSKEPA